MIELCVLPCYTVNRKRNIRTYNRNFTDDFKNRAADSCRKRENTK